MMVYPKPPREVERAVRSYAARGTIAAATALVVVVVENFDRLCVPPALRANVKRATGPGIDRSVIYDAADAVRALFGPVLGL